ncbi:MAG: S8 family serine peptidase, partial [Pyrinomonadaceae bacterium]
MNRAAGTDPYVRVRHNAQAIAANVREDLCDGTEAFTAHGTHVAGIAAGNGRAADDCGAASTYTGAAPNADIIFVKNRNVSDVARVSDSTFIADGCSYIYDQADASGQACVINISQSDDQGPHDGSLLSQEFLDNLINQPGRVLVLSAGNSNSANSHASGIVTSGATENVTLAYADAAEVIDVIEIWYDGSDRFNVNVTAPDGTTTGAVVPGTSVTEVMANGKNLVVDSRLNDPRNGDNVVSIIINADSTDNIPIGDWTIAITGTTVINGRFRMWVDRNNRQQSDFRAPHRTANEMTIADVATTKRAIAIGNHQKNNSIHGTSACGPTRDGRTKPEIAAIGSAVMSAKSRDMTLADPGFFYINMSGTSMAAPLAAGCAALLFECRGAGLSWFDIKQILADTADTTGLAVPHNAFGFGRLRMDAACGESLADVDVWLREYVGDTGDEPAAFVSWASPDIEPLDSAHDPVANPFFDIVGGVQVDNFIRVTVNNRGSKTARNTEVYLYWADPGTALHFPDDWNSTGIFTPVGAPPQWVNEGNKIVIPSIPAGGNAAVEFRWLPPLPGSNLRGDDHFCLLARAENEADGSMLTTVDGWGIFAADNNIAIRNVHVQNIDDPGDADFLFYAGGTGGDDALMIETNIPEPVYKIEIPAIAIPFRSIKFIEKLKCVYPRFSKDKNCYAEYFLDKITISKPESVKMLTDVDGAASVSFDRNTATIKVEGNRKLHIENLRVEPGEKMPVKISVVKRNLEKPPYRLTVTQLS